MDSFNPFANAWGDDTAAPSTSPDAGPSTLSKPSFNFARDDEQSTAAAHNDDDDPLGFKSSFGPSGVDGDEDAWASSQAVASTSTLTSRPDEDGWSPHPSTSSPPKHASPQARAFEDTEDSWHQSTSSPALDASPPAWAIEDDELREGGTSSHQEPRDSYTERNFEERPNEQEEEGEGGFGGFAEALPDLGSPSVRTPPIRQDSDTDWGATDLPPSEWDEHVNAPPTWQEPGTEAEDTDLDAEGTNDPWRPPEARKQRQNAYPDEEEYSNRSIDPRKTSEEAELDLERLQSELGIQIRNLDEEYAKQGTAKSPTISQKSPTIPPPSNGNKASKWSIWGSKKPTTTSGEGDNDSTARRASLDAKNVTASSSSAISPRSSISTAGIGSPTSSSPSATPDITQDSTPSNSAARTTQDQQQQQAGVSRFFRFGKGRATSADPTSTKNDSSMSSISTSIKPTSEAEKQKQKQIEITDDFSQLELFDSKRSTSANGTRPNSAYDDDFGNKQKNGDREDDGFSQRKGWFWNRNRVVDYSNEQNEESEQDLDKVFSAFSDAPPPSSSTSNTTTLNRNPSLRSQGRSTSSRGAVPGSKQDPFAHLSAAASSIRSSASIDPFDPLDPLAELNQVSNITSRHYKDQPSPRIQNAPSPILPPPSSAGMGLPRPTSSISRPGSHIFNSTSTPPPLLAPPAPLSSVSSRKTPQTVSLLDDLADLNFTSTSTNIHSTAINSPASGNGPTIVQAPVAVKPPVTSQSSTNILEDDFGDFETFSPNIAQQGTSNVGSPKKASGPMKLTSKQQNTLPKSDANFFDLL